MRRLLILLLFVCWSVGAATSYNEFYCISGGTNINAGSTTSSVADYTSVNGNWDATALTFTPTDGTYPANSNGVAAGSWASIYVDNSTNLVQASAGGSIRKIYSVAAGANGVIQFWTNNNAGTDPSTSATARSVKVGGAWRGPYGSLQFPFNYATAALTNASANIPRVNIQSGYSNIVTAAVNHTLNGPIVFQGYTTSPGDGGKGIIDGNAANNFIPLTISGNGVFLSDMIVQRAGGNFNSGLTISGGGNLIRRVVARWLTQAGSSGITVSTLHNNLVECESYGNIGNGFNITASTSLLRCLAHDNNTSGFSLGQSSTLISCIAASNAVSGFTASANGPTAGIALINCDAFTNKLHGLDITATTTTPIYVENCNFIANGGYGIDLYTNATRIGVFSNNRFGAGSVTNALGNYTPNIGATNGVFTESLSTYANNVTPYVAPTTGNFSISPTSAAYGVGNGSFTDLKYSGGTVGYPNIGAAASTNSAAAGGAYTWAQ